MNKALPILLVVTMLLTSCKKDNEESVKWIDLGLPSGLLWADRNLGATTPEEYGDEFPWGETTGRHATWWEWDWDNYLYGSSSNSLTKYCNNPEYGLNGFTDNRTQLESCDDAATVLLGSGSHTPTKDDWQELIDNTTYTVSGRGAYFTAANGKSIYLPYGYFFYDGKYMSCSLYEEDPSCAYYFFEGGNDSWVNNSPLCVSVRERCSSFPVRAVRSSRQ